MDTLWLNTDALEIDLAVVVVVELAKGKSTTSFDAWQFSDNRKEDRFIYFRM